MSLADDYNQAINNRDRCREVAREARQSQIDFPAGLEGAPPAPPAEVRMMPICSVPLADQRVVAVPVPARLVEVLADAMADREHQRSVEILERIATS